MDRPGLGSSAALRKRCFTWRENSSALKIPQMWTDKDIQEMERPILKLAQFHCLPFESVGGKPSCCQGFVALHAKQPNQWKKARTFGMEAAYLVSILPWGANWAGRTRKPNWSLDAVSSSWALRAFFTLNPRRKSKSSQPQPRSHWSFLRTGSILRLSFLG